MSGRIIRFSVATIIGCLVTAIVAGTAVRAQRLVGFDLALVDVDGATKVLGRLPTSVFAPRLSPDGTRVAFETRDRSGRDGARLWIADLSDVAGRRAVPNPVGPVDWAPMWSLDGERLVFIVSNERGDAIYVRRADGSGMPEHLLDARSAEGWMPGGKQMRFLTLREQGGNRDYDISLLDMSSRTVAPLVGLPGSAQHSSAVSPDGRWLAYVSDETGRDEIVIRHDLLQRSIGHA
jgi:Tol biopolymer transport system component